MGRRSTASRACAASPPMPSTSWSRPATRARSRPIGINLPNDQNVREQHGSKSVSLSNVNEAYDRSTPPEFRREFRGRRRRRRERRSGAASPASCTTNMHEVIGHASGKIARSAQGQSAGRVEGAVLRARGSARRSRRALLPAQSQARRARAGRRRRPGRASCRPSTRATPATRWCSCAACAKARRSRKTTCATGRWSCGWLMSELEGDRRARARRQDLLRDGRSRRRSRKASAACWRRSSGSSRKGTTRPRASCSRPTACTSIPKLRDEIVGRVDT